MEAFHHQQIVCLCESDDNIVIFDQDHWNDEQKMRGTQKQMPIETSKEETEAKKKIQQEIQASKENFFRVKIEKSRLNSSKAMKRQKDPNTIIKQGFMEKKTDGYIFNWNKRFMALTTEKLYSFQDATKSNTIGCVNLKLLAFKIEQNEQGILLDFKGECQNLLLRSSEQQMAKWKEALTEVMNFQAKTDKVMLRTLDKPIYEHIDTISEAEFIRTAETGDILLFKTDNSGAAIQRLLTNSDCDHVAMIVKMRKDEVMVFESNRSHGVSIFDWKKYIHYFDLYRKVSLRKLNYVRKAEAQNSILNFVKKNIGRNYELSLSKLFAAESDFNWENVNEERGYFCSELIAKVFKSISLLDEKKSSGRYWPVDFCQSNSIQLKKGAFLEPEQAIVLKKHTKRILKEQK